MNSLNELALYFGEDYIINDYITIHSPTVGDVVSMGEEEYYGVVSALTAIPTDMKVQLWDTFHKSWEEFSDFELFIMLTRNLPVEKTKVFFGDLDFCKFNVGARVDNGELVLFQPATDGKQILIDRNIHRKIADAIRLMHGIVPKPRKAGSKIVQQLVIEDDRKWQEIRKKEGFKPTLLPLISSMVNCAEFKYGIKEIKEMPLYAFMDSVKRISVIKNATALLQGCYSGMIDTKKINKSNLDWMKPLN